MKYIALLRGVNVGGNHRVDMLTLRQAFEQVGCCDVKTYLNTGNVVFSAEQPPTAEKLEKILENSFGFSVPVLVVDANVLARIAESIPDGWKNDDVQKSDIAFLFPPVDDASIVMKLQLNSDIETGVYVPGALLYNIERRYQSRSGLLRAVGTPLYKQMTIRNVNTVRKLAEISAE